MSLVSDTRSTAEGGATHRAPGPSSTETTAFRIALAVHAAALLLIAGLAALKPELLAERFATIEGLSLERSFAATVGIVRSLAVPALLAGGLALLALVRPGPLSRRGTWIAAVAVGAGYLALTTSLSDWIVDDAAITFAYSENLVRGHGLVLHPGHVPEEAYSTTLWMLLLAGIRAVGVPLAIGSKILCGIAGTATVVLAVRCSARLLGPGADYGRLLLAAAAAVGAPFVIWSTSGLEHALQALMMISIVALGFSEKPRTWAISACLSALVLLRPETPLIVAAVAAVFWLEFRRERVRLAALAPVVIVPLGVFVALLAFRLAYFGDPYPNPYYAKAQAATFLRIFNVFGSAWGYVLTWLLESAAVALVPVLALGLARNMPRPVRLAGAIAAAQIAFVLYAGGDWMKCYRFIAPILPLLAVIAAACASNLGRVLSPARLGVAALAVSWVLSLGTVQQLRAFRGDPTTPERVVAEIGRTFVDLAARMGIEHPTLAHHDAGGTSWEAGIDVVDLGGLGDRAIAQHMDDPEFMRRYLLVERRPTFVFGSTETFAAGRTQFHRTAEFEDLYVPVRFPGRPAMISGLCHMRRDAVREVPGVRVVRADGRVVEVVVEGG